MRASSQWRWARPWRGGGGQAAQRPGAARPRATCARRSREPQSRRRQRRQRVLAAKKRHAVAGRSRWPRLLESSLSVRSTSASADMSTPSASIAACAASRGRFPRHCGGRRGECGRSQRAQPRLARSTNHGAALPEAPRGPPRTWQAIAGENSDPSCPKTSAQTSSTSRSAQEGRQRVTHSLPCEVRQPRYSGLTGRGAGCFARGQGTSCAIALALSSPVSRSNPSRSNTTAAMLAAILASAGAIFAPRARSGARPPGAASLPLSRTPPARRLSPASAPLSESLRRVIDGSPRAGRGPRVLSGARWGGDSVICAFSATASRAT